MSLLCTSQRSTLSTYPALSSELLVSSLYVISLDTHPILAQCLHTAIIAECNPWLGILKVVLIASILKFATIFK